MRSLGAMDSDAGTAPGGFDAAGASSSAQAGALDGGQPPMELGSDSTLEADAAQWQLEGSSDPAQTGDDRVPSGPAEPPYSRDCSLLRPRLPPFPPLYSCSRCWLQCAVLGHEVAPTAGARRRNLTVVGRFAKVCRKWEGAV